MELTVELAKDDVICRGDLILWSTPVSSIVLLAEFTTNEGPWCDDYFLVIRSVERGKLMESRVDSNFGPLLEALEPRLNAQLRPGLLASTEWVSRVLWPPHFAGERYFKLTPVPSRGAWEWVKYKALGPSLDLALTDTVQEYLEQERVRLSE